MKRRRWLAGSTATLLWSRTLPARFSNLPPLRFAIVSDTHLGRKDSRSAEKNWNRAISEINGSDAEFVLHLGDVVDSARAEQYPVYAESRKRLEKPIQEIPGNHDSLELFRQHVAETIDRSVDYGRFRFLLFNNSRRDSHDGFIGEEQLEWIDARCLEAGERDLAVVICCHVPVHANRHPDRGWYVKPENGQRGFYELIERHRDRLLACFHGHFHNGIRGWRDHGDTLEVLMPSVCYNQDRGLEQRIAAGEAPGFFVDELRPGFVLAEFAGGKLELNYKPLGEPANGTFSADWK